MQDIRTMHELRERIADYRRLRMVTMDKRALLAINSIIAESEERLRSLERLAEAEYGLRGVSDRGEHHDGE